MSKKFKTVQELWNYCLYCPICQQSSRTLNLTIGPDDDFKLSEYHKVGSELKLICGYRHDKRCRRKKPTSYTAIFNINCNTNLCSIEASGIEPKILDKIKESYFFFNIDSNCNLCDKTYLSTTDLELGIDNKTIYNIQIDRESAYLLAEKDKYHITLSYNASITWVSKISLDANGKVIDDDRIIELPLIDLDFSQPIKAANKIKTVILFS